MASHYYLWLKPAEPELSRLRGLIRYLSEVYGTPCFEPHITLLSRLQGSPADLSAEITRLARNSRPFSLACHGPGFRDEFYRCLYLDVEPVPALMTLYEQAKSHLPHRDSHAFEPHVSLMYGELPVAQKQKIAEELQGDYPQNVPIDRLILYSADGAPSDWRPVEEFILGP